MELDLEIKHPQNPQNSETFKAFAVKVVVWFMVTLVIISLFMFIVWLGLFQNQKKVFSGINLYREPVVITVGEEVREVDSFGLYNIVIKPQGEVKITVKDKEGNLLTERSHSVSTSTAVTIDYFSEMNTIKQCFIRADVTNLFFKDSEAEQKEFKLGHYVILSDQASAGFLHNFNGPLNLVLTPGTYNGSELPDSIDLTDRVSGFYPVDCDHLANKEALQGDILWWTNYDPSTQRQLLEKKLEEIANSKEYNR